MVPSITLGGDGTLTITGTGNNSVILDLTRAGGVYASLDSQTAAFAPGQVNFIIVNTGGGFNNVSVYNTSAQAPVAIEDGGSDFVEIGNGYDGMQGINGQIGISNFSGYLTHLVLSDTNNAVSGRSVTIDGGGVYGLAPANIYINQRDNPLSELDIYGGSAGNTFTFNNTPNAYTYLNSGAYVNAVYVNGTASTLDVNSDGIQDVYLGYQSDSVQGLSGDVHVYNSATTSYSHLYVYDAADTTARTVNVWDGLITGLAPANIYWSDNAPGTYEGGVFALTLFAGSGGNTVNVYNTSPLFYPTYLSTGSGANTVNVYGTTGALYLDGGSGGQSVYVGDTGSLQWINGDVHVLNSSSSGYSWLYVNDSADTTGRTVNMSDGAITGLAPANIYWSDNAPGSYYGGVNYLEVDGGSGGNGYFITNTSPFSDYTYLSTGSGSNYIAISGTTGALYVDGGSGSQYVYVGGGPSGVQGITGYVDVYNSKSTGSSRLVVDDTGDTTARTVNMYDGEITGLAPAYIYWAPTATATGGVTFLNVVGDSGGNTFNVLNTSNFSDGTYLNTGAGDDTVNVYGTTGALYDFNPGGQDYTFIGTGGPALNGTLANINGNVDVNGAGSTYLYVGDGGDASAPTVNLYDGEITGLSNGTISWSPTASATGGVTNLDVEGGSGGNTFNFYNTSNFYGETYLDSGTGNDTVNVYATTGTLIDYNSAGQDSTSIGSGGAALNGTLANINGLVNVQGKGSTALYLGDGGDTNSLNVTMDDGSISGLAPAPIYWSASPAATGGVTLLSIVGSAAGSTYNITNTGNFLNGTYLQTGAGDDTVNVLATTGGLSVHGGGGSDTLVGPNLSNLWTISGPNSGKVNTTVSFSGIANLVGGSGVDVFKFIGAGKLGGTIDGGGAPTGQGDWLDYSSVLYAVAVNLAAGTATSTGGVSNIQDVHGGNHGNTLTGDAQGNILIGGSGANTIQGGSGRSLLIADKGHSTISGGSISGDILVGDATTYDSMTTAHETALMAMLAEWQSADSYATRFHDIDTGTGGGLNGSNKLNWGTTVKDAAAPDTANKLTAASASGLDWFFLDSNDTKAHFAAGDHVNNT
jgi:hypothetical protein